MVAKDPESVFAFFRALVACLNSERILRLREETILRSERALANFLPFTRSRRVSHDRSSAQIGRFQQPARGLQMQNDAKVTLEQQ